MRQRMSQLKLTHEMWRLFIKYFDPLMAKRHWLIWHTHKKSSHIWAKKYMNAQLTSNTSTNGYTNSNWQSGIEFEFDSVRFIVLINNNWVHRHLCCEYIIISLGGWYCYNAPSGTRLKNVFISFIFAAVGPPNAQHHPLPEIYAHIAMHGKSGAGFSRVFLVV